MMGCLGHIVFCALHVGAFLVFFPALFVTIPLHLIYGLMAGKKKQ